MTRSAGPSPNYVGKGSDFFISNSKKGTEYELQPDRKFFFSTDLFADVMSVNNRNMNHARVIQFNQTNLLAML